MKAQRFIYTGGSRPLFVGTPSHRSQNIGGNGALRVIEIFHIFDGFVNNGFIVIFDQFSTSRAQSFSQLIIHARWVGVKYLKFWAKPRKYLNFI